VLINWVDLIGVARDPLHVYHLWLIAMYFAPFLPLVLLYGVKDFKLFLAMGLLTSLMNDLFYFFASFVLMTGNFTWSQLWSFYAFQLGLDGWQYKWVFQGGIIQFPVYSWLMALSIYARIAIVIISSELWIRKSKIKSL